MIEIQTLTFGYSSAREVLSECSLNLEPHSISALVGPNGAGKTTLLNLLTGFLKPQSGKILFSGRNLNRYKPYQINRLGICRTFQDLRLINKLTVQENVVLAMSGDPTDQWYTAIVPRLFHRSVMAQRSLVAREIINRLFLEEVRDNLAGEISFGQQKFLSIACCIANGADVLLLDEPVAGVNPDLKVKMTDLFKELKQRGKTIFFIDHDTDFINRVCDSVYFLAEGRLKRFNSLVELRADPSVIAAYLI